MKTDTLFSSCKEDWGTPQWLFDKINDIFHFQLDVCASPDNAKCKRFYTKKDNGLLMPWSETNWMNPPYGRHVSRWLEKAANESRRGKTTVCLLPVRTDTAWWHDYIENNANATVLFIRGRLKFEGAEDNAPFPSAIVFFWGNYSLEEIYNAHTAVRKKVNFS